VDQAVLDFERLAARQRGGWRRYGLAAAVLLVGGVVVALAGVVTEGVARLPLIAGGVLAAALAVLPWREALERRDRADGLEVLGEEWAALAPDDEGGRRRLLALALAMFGRAPAARVEA
jgi:hypothetical protein